MDPVTKAKIKFVYDKEKGGKDDAANKTNNEMVHIEDYISPDQLECEYGGNYNFSYNINDYWNALLEHTGKPYKVIDYM